MLAILLGLLALIFYPGIQIKSWKLIYKLVVLLLFQKIMVDKLFV